MRQNDWEECSYSRRDHYGNASPTTRSLHPSSDYSSSLSAREVADGELAPPEDRKWAFEYPSSDLDNGNGTRVEVTESGLVVDMTVVSTRDTEKVTMSAASACDVIIHDLLSYLASPEVGEKGAENTDNDVGDPELDDMVSSMLERSEQIISQNTLSAERAVLTSLSTKNSIHARI